MRGRNVVLWVVAIGVLAALAGWAFRAQPVSVETAEVTKGQFEQTIDDDGKTRVRDRYTVSAPLAGRIMRINLKAGDAVEQGHVVAVIVPAAPLLQDERTVRELEERLGAAQANVLRSTAMVERAKAAHEQARADAARSARLAAGGFVSASNLEQAELSVRMKDKELDAVRFERQAHERELAQARAALMRERGDSKSASGARLGFDVYAPISGRVLKVVQESEGPVAMGTALIEMGDIGKLEAVVDVLSTEAVGISLGTRVHIEAGADKPRLEGRVRLIEPSAFTKVSALGVEEQRVNVIVDFISPHAAWQTLGDGYRVDARIVVHRADDAVLVPTGALFRDGVSFAVFVVDGAFARKRIIETPRRNDRHALVTKGLEAGAKVIVFPGDSVRDGLRIEPRNARPN